MCHACVTARKQAQKATKMQEEKEDEGQTVG
jgi:hypothetical protein